MSMVRFKKVTELVTLPTIVGVVRAKGDMLVHIGIQINQLP